MYFAGGCCELFGLQRCGLFAFAVTVWPFLLLFFKDSLVLIVWLLKKWAFLNMAARRDTEGYVGMIRGLWGSFRKSRRE